MNRTQQSISRQVKIGACRFFGVVVVGGGGRGYTFLKVVEFVFIFIVGVKGQVDWWCILIVYMSLHILNYFNTYLSLTIFTNFSALILDFLKFAAFAAIKDV